MIRKNKIGIELYFLFLIVIFVITDLIILYNIPFLRQILAFIIFTTLPGIVILHTLKINNIGFLKMFVLAVGLSVAFLMFSGLFINYLYPIIEKPLSLIPVLVSFNIILMLLIVIAYVRNKDNTDFFNNFYINIDLKNKLACAFFFPFLFPFAAVLGTFLMNTRGNNVIILLLLFLIPVYIIAIVYLSDRIHKATYPVAIWMIGMSLLLMHGLTSYHLMGRDVHGEYYCFQLALENYHWTISDYYHANNSCLSVTILPMVYYTLSSINSEYIFKLFFGLIGSITPIAVYIISKKYIGARYAFLASLLFIFQFAFIYSQQSSTKQEIATVFFTLCILIFFDLKINILNKKIILSIFMFSVIVSHYTTSYIFFIFLMITSIVSLFEGVKNDETIKKPINISITILFFTVIFFWYSQITRVPFLAGVNFIEATFNNLQNFFIEESRSTVGLNVVGKGLEQAAIPNIISVYVHDAIFLTIGIGVLSIFFYKSYRKIIDTEYYIGIFTFVGLLAFFLVLPFVSKGYGSTRFFLQTLVFLAPAFVIGGNTIAKIIRKPGLDVVILLILLISAFSCVTYLTYHCYNIPASPDYENDGPNRDEYYIYDQELISANWLKGHGEPSSKVCKDFHASKRLLLAYGLNNPFKYAMLTNKSSDGYIYLTHVNVNDKEVYSNYRTSINISDYSGLFENRWIIYNNGGSMIYG
ncbi:MAG: DUF2206 domain-containing protein [Deltaproteobacteria bacterium]|nr:DUF2206 domain-containing protein [Deltaproteobacteria bacterium]